MSQDLRNDFYKKVINKDIQFFDATRSGELSKTLFVV